MYKLMIVDDEKVEREVIRMFLDKGNLDITEIEECASGTEALQKVFIFKPDIILMDINMPGLNGLEVLDHIKIANIKTKVIFSTAYGYFEYAQKAIQLGAFDYLLKPVSESTINKVLTKAIDDLDLEQEKLERESKYNDFLYYMGNQIVKNMVTGTINEEVVFYLDTLGLSENAIGQCFYVRFDEDQMNMDVLNELRDQINEKVTKLSCQSICYTKHNSLIFVVFIPNQELVNLLSEPIYNTCNSIIESYFKRHKKGYKIEKGILFNDIHGIENSFNTARARLGDIIASDEIEKDEQSQEIYELMPVIKSYIESSCERKLTLDDIANKFGYSKYYINRVFKQLYHRTIIDYHIHCRMEKAKHLLENYEYSIRSISELLGYSDSNYFTWIFKKVEGISPVKYRYNRQSNKKEF